MRVYSTGGREGKTFQWKACDHCFNFVDGVCEIENATPELLQYLKVNLQVKTDFDTQPVAPQQADRSQETDLLRIAILDLDAEDDLSWNSDDQPMLEALADKFPNLSRKQVNALASDLTRDAVRDQKRE